VISSNWTAWWSELNSKFRTVLQTVLGPTLASEEHLCTAGTEPRRPIAYPEIVVYTRRESKPMPLFVPIPGQLFHEAAQGELRERVSLQQRLDPLWGNNRSADHLAPMALAFARRLRGRLPHLDALCGWS